jgi:hypothetical protein
MLTYVPAVLSLRIYDHFHGASVDPEVGSWRAGHSSGGPGGGSWGGLSAGAHDGIWPLAEGVWSSATHVGDDGVATTDRNQIEGGRDKGHC